MPDAWVARIFARQEALYGALFLDRWRDTDPATVRAVWAEELAGFADRPQAIGEALRALIHHPLPPTLPEFVALCREHAKRLDMASLPALPAPRLTREQMAARAAQARAMISGLARAKGAETG